MTLLNKLKALAFEMELPNEAGFAKVVKLEDIESALHRPNNKPLGFFVTHNGEEYCYTFTGIPIAESDIRFALQCIDDRKKEAKKQ